MKEPIVTVICLCYNQVQFVEEAIRSVIQQTYREVQLIVVDDASNDGSQEVIRSVLSAYPSVTFLSLSENVGNCKAFNLGLQKATGAFIIDLAADDVLLPSRIEHGVATLTSLGDQYGVHFSDAEWIHDDGTHHHLHSSRYPHHVIPQGDVYIHLIKRYFICSPTMMFRRRVIDALNGYDEDLAYEDFDFWIRSSRNYYYCYSPEVLVKKRIVKRSLHHEQFTGGSIQRWSTYRVCRKISMLNKNKNEDRALFSRLLYEMRVSLQLGEFFLALKFLVMACKQLPRLVRRVK